MVFISPLLPADEQVVVSLASVPKIGSRTIQKIVNWSTAQRMPLSAWWHDASAHVHTLALAQRQSLVTWQQQWSPQTWTEYLHDKHIWWITKFDPAYPFLLHQIPDHPMVLFGQSNFQHNARDSRCSLRETLALTAITCVAIVGTRQPTPYGERVTRDITTQLCNMGITIVSGFMYGIDMMAHQSALQAGGQTLGVLGSGHLAISPYQQQRRYQEMQSQGMVFVSEYPPLTQASKGTFPARNRIVAGLCQATVVIEAAGGSGSLITAQHALDYGREVAAVPGSIYSIYSDGTKWLLNQGATLVASGHDVLELVELPVKVRTKDKGSTHQAGNQGKAIISLLQSQSLTFDQLSTQLDISVSDLAHALTQLEISGTVTRRGGEWWLT